MPAPAPLQFCNSLLHRYHRLSVVVNWLVWSVVLIAVAPIGILVYSIYCLYELLFVSYSSVPPNQKQAILITGCDTGFGNDMARAAVKAGYTVFAGCLDPSKCSIPGASVVAMDVTQDSHVNAAIQNVANWVKQEDGRYLFALVNNAGVGRGGPIDWAEMEDFEFCMNVNYFGLIRCIKATLPLFRRQYPQHRGRVVNITSMAGLMGTAPIFTAYASSKHAANVASHALRAECKDFLDVVTVNPSFHETPLVHLLNTLYTKEHFEKLPAELRSFYGQDYVLGLRFPGVEFPQQWMWRREVVLDQMMNHVLRRYDPPGQVLIGFDAKFALVGLRLLPPWLEEMVLGLSNPLPTPAFCLQSRKKKD